ncbi:hypothetical protein [Haloferax gibbonsii]|uniref:hypothetical protein n=1 Tax=Haloferax gibbonsii TaxID=35746 RepID=UPI001267AD49|nr:hypothetical protein [Haloferax gibbonsii]
MQHDFKELSITEDFNRALCSRQSQNMTSIAPLIGLFAAPFFVILVYLDTTRRSLPQLTRLLWAGSVGVMSFIGFLLPALFENLIHQVYFFGIKSNPVVSTPYEILVLHFSVGLIISLLAFFLYVFGSRNLSANDDSPSGTY